jgi:hypothetical protein
MLHRLNVFTLIVSESGEEFNIITDVAKDNGYDPKQIFKLSLNLMTIKN